MCIRRTYTHTLHLNVNNLLTLVSTRLRFPKDDVDALKRVGVLKIYRILLIYIYSAFFGLDNKITCPKFMMYNGIRTLVVTNPWFKTLHF
jgi:hypothetical protein